MGMCYHMSELGQLGGDFEIHSRQTVFGITDGADEDGGQALQEIIFVLFRGEVAAVKPQSLGDKFISGFHIGLREQLIAPIQYFLFDVKAGAHLFRFLCHARPPFPVVSCPGMQNNPHKCPVPLGFF